VLWGGAIARVAADETAFGQRDGRFHRAKTSHYKRRQAKYNEVVLEY